MNFDGSFLTINSGPCLECAIILNYFYLLGLQHLKTGFSTDLHCPGSHGLVWAGPPVGPSFTVSPCSGKGMVWNRDDSQSCHV